MALCSFLIREGVWLGTVPNQTPYYGCGENAFIFRYFTRIRVKIISFCKNAFTFQSGIIIGF